MLPEGRNAYDKSKVRKAKETEVRKRRNPNPEKKSDDRNQLEERGDKDGRKRREEEQGHT